MQLVGYQLIEFKTGAIIQQWGGEYGCAVSKPNMIIVPNGDHVHCPELDVDYGGATLVEWSMNDPRFYGGDNKPLSIDVCQQAQIVLVNEYVSSELAKSDWTIIRGAEGYKPASSEILAYRKSVRDQGNALVAEIKSITDFDTITKWQPHDWPVMK